MEIGQVIKYIRTNKGITQKALADGIGMIRTSIARIETGKQVISSDKLTDVLDYCNVTYHEFFFIKNDYMIPSKMTEFNDALKLYYGKKIPELTNLKNEVNEKYEQTGDILFRHLFILCSCLENNLDIERINPEYIDEISDYLLSIEDWCYYELMIFNNFLWMVKPKTALLMSKKIMARAKKYKELQADNKILCFILFNLIDICIAHGEYQGAKPLLDTAKQYFTDQTQYFEQTLILFYEGLFNIIDGMVTEGTEKCNTAINISRALKHDYFAEKYQKDLDKVLENRKITV